MPAKPFSQDKLRIADLPAGGTLDILLEPNAETRAAIAAELGIPALRKLRLSGKLRPLGKADWQLDAMLGATVVQDCVVTLAPVTTRLDEPVERIYLANPPEIPEADEMEMPEDDTTEPLPAVLDLRAVVTEALALALPPYPHAEGVDPVSRTFAESGIAPLDDEAAKPFAGLAALRDKLSDGDT
ncbi:MAG: DUF177 domain-containing protein [Rhodobacter sp.]|nr:DUF177 domain-containing protein [Rhodobacter sp.]